VAADDGDLSPARVDDRRKDRKRRSDEATKEEYRIKRRVML
jgi:hypothetical protein